MQEVEEIVQDVMQEVVQEAQSSRAERNAADLVQLVVPLPKQLALAAGDAAGSAVDETV